MCVFTGKDATPEPYYIRKIEAREGYIKARGTDVRTDGGATDTDAHSAPMRETGVILGAG